MDLAGDRRGQSIQIGAVLLFGALIIAFASYQAFVVPNQNRGVEFNHNQEVQSDMQDVRNAIVSVGGSGDGRSVTVQLGTRYPSRLLARNPSPPSGSLNTLGTADDRVGLRISNAQAAGETGDFWNESQRYNSGGLIYRPNYNVYGNAPATTYDNTVLYNRFDSGNITVANQSFIDGTEISLVVLNGSISRSSTEATSVDVRPVSSSTERIRIEDDGSEPLNITFASTRSAAYWDFLESQPNVTSVTTTSSGNGFYNVSVELKQDETYTLRLTKVGVGSGVTGEDAAYLTDIDGDGATVTQGETTELTLEVRDRFNNPPDDAAQLRVNGSVADSGSLQSTSKVPDEDGQVTFTYKAPSSGTGAQEIEFSYLGIDNSFDASTPENVSMTVEVTETSSESGGSSGSDAGNGGSSAYSTSDDTVTVSGGNGLWTGITYTDQLRLSSANPVLTHNNGYDEIETRATLRNGTHSYSIRVQIERKDSGSFNVRQVDIREETPSSQNKIQKSLSVRAAKQIFNSSAYTGVNVLAPSSYSSPGATLNQTLYRITELDSASVDVLFSDVYGRTNATLWDRSLIVEAQPDPTGDDDIEYVSLNFMTPVDTSGWTLEAQSGATTDLPSETVDGQIYLANDTSAFDAEYSSVASNQVYQLDTTLEDSGENLSIVDADGDIRDELAYSDDGTDSPQTSRGWTVNDVSEGDILNRTQQPYFYTDTDSASDWSLTTTGTTLSGFSSVDAADLLPSTSGQNQSFTFTPDGEIPSGTTVSIALEDPQSGGVDYSNTNGKGATVGSVTANSNNGKVWRNWTASDGAVSSGTTVRVWVDSVDTGATQSDPYGVTMTRQDSGEASAAAFSVGRDTGGSELQALSVSNLSANTNGQTQTITFEPTTTVPAGDYVSISLVDAQAPSGEVDYPAGNTAPSIVTGSGSVTWIDQTDDNASIRYKAPSGGLASGQTIEIEVTNVDTGGMSGAPYTVGFSRGDAGTASTTFGTSEAKNTNFVTGSGTSTGGNNNVEFELENTGSSQVSITGIAFNSTDSGAEYIEDEDDTIEFEDETSNIDLLNARIDRADLGGTVQPLDTSATIGSGNRVTFNLGQFRTGQDNRGTVNMNNQQVTITLTFSDGTSRQYTIST